MRGLGDYAGQELELRVGLRDRAEALTGLSYAAGGAIREKYKAEVWPHDTPADREDMARHQSSCMLVQEAIARPFGLDEIDARFALPYANRVRHGGVWYTGALLITVAGPAGALIDATHWTGDPSEVLDIGDFLVVGKNGGDPAWARGAFAAFEHGLTITDLDTGTCSAVEGGQPGILELTHELLVIGTELWLGAAGSAVSPDGRPAHGRRVHYIIDPWSLPLSTPDNRPLPPARSHPVPPSNGSSNDDDVQITPKPGIRPYHFPDHIEETLSESDEGKATLEALNGLNDGMSMRLSLVWDAVKSVDQKQDENNREQQTTNRLLGDYHAQVIVNDTQIRDLLQKHEDEAKRRQEGDLLLNGHVGQLLRELSLNTTADHERDQTVEEWSRVSQTALTAAETAVQIAKKPAPAPLSVHGKRQLGFGGFALSLMSFLVAFRDPIVGYLKLRGWTP